MSEWIEGCCNNAQKEKTFFVNFVNTSSAVHAIIINVKTPQYIIWFLLHPIVKIPSPKKGSGFGPVFFTLSGELQRSGRFGRFLLLKELIYERIFRI